MLIENKDFIIVGLQAWDSPIGSNCINIALEIAGKNRVLFVNPPLDRVTLMRKNSEDSYIFNRREDILKGKKKKLEKVSENLWVLTPMRLMESINMLPDGMIYDLFNKRNNRIFAREISAAAKELEFSEYYLFNDGDMFRSFYLAEMLDPEFSIYYTRDFFLAVPYWQKHGLRLEPALMKKSDLVVSNSVYLNKIAEKYNTNSAYIGQGCDFSLFKPEAAAGIPEEIAKIPSPRIGYIGALTDIRLDISLLEGLARSRPDWNIILTGPEDEAFERSALHQLSNIHFTGPRPMEKLASYLKGFDVAINPQKFNEVTIGNYPRKIDEYLAMGLPVVATSTETMEVFKDHVYLGMGLEEYLELIQKALKEDNPERRTKRRAFALDHSWENSVNALYNAILNSKEHVDKRNHQEK